MHIQASGINTLKTNVQLVFAQQNELMNVENGCDLIEYILFIRRYFYVAAIFLLSLRAEFIKLIGVAFRN